MFTVDVVLPVDVRTVWRELTDWAGHGDWIPLTTVDVDPADPARFVAWSGFGRRLALEDRMVARDRRFDGTTGTCRVDKLGPVLVGFAELTVDGDESTARVRWHEDVTVPYLPAAFTGLVGRLGARLFAAALFRLADRAR